MPENADGKTVAADAAPHHRLEHLSDCGPYQSMYVLGKILQLIATITPEQAECALARAHTLNETRGVPALDADAEPFEQRLTEALLARGIIRAALKSSVALYKENWGLESVTDSVVYQLCKSDTSERSGAARAANKKE